MLSILSKLYPKKVGRNLAFVGLAMGLGAIAGPLLAPILNDWGGFSLPFITIGLLQCSLTCATMYLVPKIQRAQNVTCTSQNQPKLQELHVTALIMVTDTSYSILIYLIKYTDLHQHPLLLNPLFDCVLTNMVTGMLISMVPFYMLNLGATTFQLGENYAINGVIYSLGSLLGGTVRFTKFCKGHSNLIT